MDYVALNQPVGMKNYYRTWKYRIEFRREHTNYFDPVGTMIFTGKQGSGKTLSGVNYVCNLLGHYPCAILCTNTVINDYPYNAVVDMCEGGPVIRSLADGGQITSKKILEGEYKKVCIEYDGLDCLKNIENGEYGVLYFIDELHLELNSLESKNIDIDVMTEISQQRKQRKHIVGTSQVYMRLAKPLREQIFDVVICRCFMKSIQYNRLIDGEETEEANGKLKYDVKKHIIYFHSPEMYNRYDTYAKMRRYRNEWQGHKRDNNPMISINNVIKRK